MGGRWLPPNLEIRGFINAMQASVLTGAPLEASAPIVLAASYPETGGSSNGLSRSSRNSYATNFSGFFVSDELDELAETELLETVCGE